jgi:acetoacetyl-CoA reductase/3-oxoacyl-[acyl-carrier protein] reductase
MSKKEIISKAGLKKIDNIPIGRIAEMDEISEVIIFLCENKSSYITGQTININGGMLFT